MKHVDLFGTFLRDAVNLNRTRIETLEKRVATLEEFVVNSGYGAKICRFNPQGSWAHQTIIKPPNGKDFDADLLAIVKPVAGWESPEYIEGLYRAFRGSDTYKEMVSRKTRCVRINYAGDFHVDLIPIIEEIGHNGIRFLNCIRTRNQFEPTAPEEYTDWWNERNDIVGNNQLQEVTRLLKYLRDIKQTFSCKSILLTTLIGYQVYDDDNLRPQAFSDTPTSLKTIINRLDDCLQERPQMPEVQNPVLREEHYNRHWNPAKYKNFRDSIHRYREWIDDAYGEKDPNDSILKWRRVFDNAFAKGVTTTPTTLRLTPFDLFTDHWIDLIKREGPQALQRFPTNVDYLEPPKWPVAQRIPVAVHATQSATQGGNVERTINSGDTVPAGKWLQFTARCQTALPKSFSVWWRVTNTGEHAAQKESLRGKFYTSSPVQTRNEQTEYRGVHWVEAFIVNNRNGECVGVSAPFFVVIE